MISFRTPQHRFKGKQRNQERQEVTNGGSSGKHFLLEGSIHRYNGQELNINKAQEYQAPFSIRLNTRTSRSQNSVQPAGREKSPDP
jgi:hypothetical protein